jgi:hypothetical protein
MSAKSYEGRYHMPGHIYIARSMHKRIEGKRVYKIGGTTAGTDERMRTLQGKGGIWDWELVYANEHPTPFHVETRALRLLKPLMIHHIDGVDCGREIIASADERIVLEAVADALTPGAWNVCWKEIGN